MGQLVRHVEAAHAGERDEDAVVGGLFELRDHAGATGDIGFRLELAALRIGRLDHADQALGRHGVARHLEIARLENIERQAPARQQQHAGERKDRNDRRQFAHRPLIHIVAKAHTH